MSDKQKQLPDRIRDKANAKRGLQTFGPDHPAVRAAKRYCERTGKSWNVGIGGRCELGKRAIKQWTYEATRPVRKAWQYAVAKWVTALVISLVLVVIGLLTIPKVVSVVFLVVGCGAAIFFGSFAGYTGATEKMSEFHDFDKIDQVSFVLGWILGVPVALVVFAGVKLANQTWWRDAKRILAIIGQGIFVLVVLGALGLAIAAITAAGAWLQALAIVAVVVIVSGLCYLVILVANKLEERGKRKRARAMSLLRGDNAAQAAALEQLKPVLEDVYHMRQNTSQHELTYEEWVKALGAELTAGGYAWTDLIQQGVTYTDRSDRFGYLYDLPTVGLHYYRLVDGIGSLLADSPQSPRKQRVQRAKQSLSFVAASLFLLKSKVCPSVELPPWDDVKTQR